MLINEGLSGQRDLQAGMAFIGYPGGRGGFDGLRESFIYSRSRSTQFGSWRYDVRAELFNALNSGFDLSHSAGVNGYGTTAGAQSSANYERTDQVMDSRVFRVAVTARF